MKGGRRGGGDEGTVVSHTIPTWRISPSTFNCPLPKRSAFGLCRRCLFFSTEKVGLYPFCPPFFFLFSLQDFPRNTNRGSDTAKFLWPVNDELIEDPRSRKSKRDIVLSKKHKREYLPDFSCEFHRQPQAWSKSDRSGGRGGEGNKAPILRVRITSSERNLNPAIYGLVES